MAVDLSPAWRIAGRGVAAAGALAAGAAIGTLAERALFRAGLRDAPDVMMPGAFHGESMRLTIADGTQLHVEVDSSSIPADPLTIVFAHGYALSMESWNYQRQALQGKARLVFYDQRSHGRSSRADFDTHHVDQLGADLAEVIEHLAPTGPLMLVGHSMGGMTIMALADQHPELFEERVFGVALIATSAGALDQGSLGLPSTLGTAFHRLAPAVAALLAKQKSLVEKSRWGDTDLGVLLTRMYAFGSHAPDQAGRFVAGMLSATPMDVIAEFLPALQEHDKHDVLHVLQCVEVLVVAGDSDRLTPREMSDEIVAAIPGAEYVVVDDAGHMVTIEKHEIVDELLLGLLARVRRDLAEGMDP